MSKVYRAACETPISRLYGNFQTTLLRAIPVKYLMRGGEWKSENVEKLQPRYYGHEKIFHSPPMRYLTGIALS